MKLFTFSRRCKRIAVICFLLCSGLNAQTAGDANGDNKYDISDVVYGINYIFGGGPAPRFGDETITLKWAAPGASSQQSYAERYRVIRRQRGSEFFDTLFEFPAGNERGGDTVRVTVNLPVDGKEYEWKVRWQFGYVFPEWHTIPGLIVARVGKEWRKEDGN